MLEKALVITALAIGGIVTQADGAQGDGVLWSGKWVLDIRQSNAPQGLTGLEERIKQNGAEIEVESKFPEPANGVLPLMYLGILTNSFKLKADGSEVVNQIGPFMHTSRTTAAGNSLETEWKSQVDGQPVQGHWQRTLSDDGKRMTLKVIESSTHGQAGNAELVFKKK